MPVVNCFVLRLQVALSMIADCNLCDGDVAYGLDSEINLYYLDCTNEGPEQWRN